MLVPILLLNKQTRYMNSVHVICSARSIPYHGSRTIFVFNESEISLRSSRIKQSMPICTTITQGHQYHTKKVPIPDPIKIYYIRPKHDNSPRFPDSWPTNRYHRRSHSTACTGQRDFHRTTIPLARSGTYSRSSLHDVIVSLPHYFRTFSRKDVNHSSDPSSNTRLAGSCSNWYRLETCAKRHNNSK